jgi:hypothetical protein
MTQNAQQVSEQIELAFAGVRLEQGISIREAMVIDHFGTEEDRQQARAQDEKEDWTKVPDDLINSHSASLSYFDAGAMHFYLPAFMRFTLRNYQKSSSPSICCTVFALDEDCEKLPLLTTPQKEAVKQFLEFMASQDVLRNERNDAKRALEFWLRADQSTP